eukprot:gene23189-30057_t
MLSRSIRRLYPTKSTIKSIRFGSDHHGPSLPPFAQQRPPTAKLPIEADYVWDDNVAPEACLDFDAPHIPLSTVLTSIAIMSTFIYSVYALITWSDPVESNPVAVRGVLFNKHEMDYYKGKISLEEFEALQSEVSEEEE